MAGKLQVGHALADHRMRWTGYLWAVAGRPGYGFRGEVKAPDLPALRVQVGGWLEKEGPWWTAERALRRLPASQLDRSHNTYKTVDMNDKQVRSEEARRNLRDLLDEVEHHDVHVTILRYDKPAAVLVST